MHYPHSVNVLIGPWAQILHTDTEAQKAQLNAPIPKEEAPLALKTLQSGKAG